MKVLKFGGTSVGSVESLLNVKSIVEACEEQVIVVVSAMSGVTDYLLHIAERAAAHEAGYESEIDALYDRHVATINAVVPAEHRNECVAVMDTFIKQSLPQLYAMLYSNPDLDEVAVETLREAIVCHGEVLSSAIVASMIAEAVPHFSPRFIKTHEVDGYRQLNWPLTEQRVTEEFAGDEHPIHVIQGFIAGDTDSDLKTTLGRGGSDYTAAIVAAVLEASQLEIWTDVDGFYDSDPKRNSDAKLIERMTYDEAQALCDAGAKVIYPPTIAPVAMKNIPVLVKNTFNPSAPGTIIY